LELRRKGLFVPLGLLAMVSAALPTGCVVDLKDYPLASVPSAGGSLNAAGAQGSTGGAGGSHVVGFQGGEAPGGAGGQGGSVVAGASGVGGASVEPKCAVRDAVVTDSLLSVTPWQDYSGKFGDCGKCAHIPCGQTTITWQYPVAVTSATTFRSTVQGGDAALVSMLAGTCGSENEKCSLGYSFSASFEFNLTPTASGWKVTSVNQVFSVPDYPDTSPFIIGSVVCPQGYHFPQLEAAMSDDLYGELKAALLQQEFPCP